MPSDGAARGLLTFAALIVVFAGLRAAAAIAVPILLALFVAFVSAPAVFRLCRWGVPYAGAVTLVLLGEIGVLVGIGTLLGSPVDEFRERLPVYTARLEELARDFAARLGAYGVDVNAEEVSQLIDPGSLFELVGSTVQSLGAVLSQGVLVLFIVAFTLFDASRLWKRVEDHYRDTTAGEHVLSRVTDELNRYLGVKTVTSGATGFFCGVWCWTLGVDFALLWGMLSFLLNYIPNLGALLATIPPFLIALVMIGPWTAFALAVGYLVVNMIIGSVIEPRIMGQALGISPVVVLLSMVVWGWVLGPVGALLSVPLTMIVKLVMKNTHEWVWMSDLMSDAQRHSQWPGAAVEDSARQPAAAPTGPRPATTARAAGTAKRRRPTGFGLKAAGRRGNRRRARQIGRARQMVGAPAWSGDLLDEHDLVGVVAVHHVVVELGARMAAQVLHRQRGLQLLGRPVDRRPEPDEAVEGLLDVHLDAVVVLVARSDRLVVDVLDGANLEADRFHELEALVPGRVGDGVAPKRGSRRA